MRNAKLKTLDIDNRGRITLPSDYREGVDSFAVKPQSDGTLVLIPQRSVSIDDAKLLESLKKSANEFKKGKLHKIPSEWTE